MFPLLTNKLTALQVYLFATPARMVRPVQYLPTGQTELIGSLEQACPGSFIIYVGDPAWHRLQCSADCGKG